MPPQWQLLRRMQTSRPVGPLRGLSLQGKCAMDGLPMDLVMSAMSAMIAMR